MLLLRCSLCWMILLLKVDVLMLQSNALPTDLLNKLLEVKSSLAHCGTLSPRFEKGRSITWRIRVRHFIEDLGYRKMLGITVPEHLVPAVTDLLGTWKAEYNAQLKARAEQVENARRALRVERLEHRWEREVLRLLVPKAQRRRVLREFEALKKMSEIAATLYILGKEYLKVPERKNKVKGEGKRVEGCQLEGTAAPAGYSWSPVPVQELVRRKMRERRVRVGLEVRKPSSSFNC